MLILIFKHVLASDFWKQLGFDSKPEFDLQDTAGLVRKWHVKFDTGKTQFV